LAAVVDKDFGDIPSVDVDGDDHGVGMWERSYVNILGSVGYGYVRPFGLSDAAFDGNVIDLAVIVSHLPLGVKISVGAFGDCEDYAMDGESIGLLQRFADLWWRWWQWVGF
jgi:hypothetical protein